MIRRVGVIGAGPSGITAVRSLRDAGFEVVCFDANTEVGGNWLFREEPSHSSVFETTHIISSKTLSSYPSYPMPADYPDYPSHRQLAAYFQGYARHHDLYSVIRFGHEVLEAAPLPGHRWALRVRGPDGHETTETVDALAVANGHHWKPRVPTYPGTFTGKMLHSHAFKRAAPFAGQRVLVIGGGNSACDVAVETARVSAMTAISWRRGYWIVPKFMFGRPSDVVNQLSDWLPRALRMRLNQGMLRLLQGRNAAYGLPEPDHLLGATHPTVNSELLYAVRHGHVLPRPDIARFDGQTVHFTDGRAEAFDVIIACTGYWISHPFFRSEVIDFSSGPVPLYLRMLPADHPTLAFIGLFQPLGCIWPAAELQSDLFARMLTGVWRPPADLRAAIADELAHPDYPQLDTPRHTITVDFHAFRKRLLKQLAA